jgi:hypothetical protein
LHSALTKDQEAYAERTGLMAQQARDALLKEICKDWEAAKGAGLEAAGLELTAINRLRDAGFKIQEASGHEQADFEFYHVCADKLPKGMTFKAMQLCIKLSRNFTEPVKSLDEARSARQMMFEAFGESRAPKRIEEQVAHDKNFWSDFVNRFASVDAMLARQEEEKPMSKWLPAELDRFLRSTQLIADKRAMAEKLLLKV